MSQGQQGPHDLGGLPGNAIDQSEHDLTFFDRRVDAMLRLLVESPRHHFSVDALRRAIEQLSEEKYGTLSYYERWMDAIARLVVERKLVSQAALDQRIAKIKLGAKAMGEKAP